jgi:hypothetical protein
LRIRTHKLNSMLGISLLIAFVLACNFSATTANIGSLKLGKDKSVNQETTNFSPSDTIYAVATISNALSSVKVKGRLAIEDVKGHEKGPIPGLETTLDLPGSGTATFTFTPPPTDWPKGTYKIDVFMLNESGEQKDQKSASFTVS